MLGNTLLLTTDPVVLIYSFLLIFARCYGIMFICPLFSKSFFPGLLKSSLAMLLSGVIVLKFQLPSSINFMFFTVLVIKEFAYGACLSYLLAIPIWTIESAGKVIDLQRGEQMGAVVNKITNNPSSSIGKLLIQGFITYLAINNGIAFCFDIFIKSFNILPLTSFVLHFSINDIIAVFVEYCFYSIMLALPVMVLMFILEFTLGLISSFIPQLNVTVISMSIKSAVALFVLIFYMQPMFHIVMSKFTYSMDIINSIYKL